MPRKCFIPGCSANSKKNSCYTPVFSFPKVPNRRQKWMDILKTEIKVITVNDPGINACLCIHHFDQNLIEKHENMNKSTEEKRSLKYKLRLTKDAIPSNLQPYTDSAVNNRKFIRGFRRRGRGISLLKPKVQMPISNNETKTVTISPTDELIQKIKLEQLRISTISEHLEDYGPEYFKTELNRNYRIFQQTNEAEENPLGWAVDQVAKNVLEICSNEDIARRFREQEIDGSGLLDLSKEDLINLLNVKMGPSIKISHFIEMQRKKVCEKFIIWKKD